MKTKILSSLVTAGALAVGVTANANAASIIVPLKVSPPSISIGDKTVTITSVSGTLMSDGSTSLAIGTFGTSDVYTVALNNPNGDTGSYTYTISIDTTNPLLFNTTQLSTTAFAPDDLVTAAITGGPTLTSLAGATSPKAPVPQVKSLIVTDTISNSTAGSTNGQVSGVTNTFTQAVPEPLTTAGAGLALGLCFLVRRNSRLVK